MLEPNTRTRLGGVSVVVAGIVLGINHGVSGILAGVTLFGLWFFAPPVYVFVGGQVVIVTLYAARTLEWGVLVVEVGSTFALLAPSLRAESTERRIAVLAAAVGCIVGAWIGLRTVGFAAVAGFFVFLIMIAATLASRYERVIIQGDPR